VKAISRSISQKEQKTNIKHKNCGFFSRGWGGYQDHGQGCFSVVFLEIAGIPDAAGVAFICRESGPKAIATEASPGFG
jgi:hypothetical protein